jgi:hypothetical protein
MHQAEARVLQVSSHLEQVTLLGRSGIQPNVRSLKQQEPDRHSGSKDLHNHQGDQLLCLRPIALPPPLGGPHSSTKLSNSRPRTPKTTE